jgi:hypothetical protein
MQAPQQNNINRQNFYLTGKNPHDLMIVIILYYIILYYIILYYIILGVDQQNTNWQATSYLSH